MKNTNETLANGKFYTTRISDCVTRQYEPDLEGYVLRPKDSFPVYKPKRILNIEKEPNPEVFVYGTGWKKVSGKNVEPVTVLKIETYSQVFDLVQKYGYHCASEMIGFDLASYGDKYPILDICCMEHYGVEFVNYLERIADLDYKILQYFVNTLGLKVKNSSYDMWIEKGGNEKADYECSFRTNPFLGFHLTTSLFTYIHVTPHIDPISWDEALFKIIVEFHPDYKMDGCNVERAEEVHKKYDAIGCHGWIKLMCGEEDANWLKENLTFQGKPIEKAPEPVKKVKKIKTAA